MASNRNTDDLLAELDSLGLGSDSTTPSQPDPATKPLPSAPAPSAPSAPAADDDDDDVLRDLQAQLASKPPGPASSRPGTPRLSSSTTSAGTSKRAEHTPASSGPNSQRTSEERLRSAAAPARTSGEGRAYHRGYTPEPYRREEQEVRREPVAAVTQNDGAGAAAGGGGGGWWGGFGGLLSTATAAVKQAESLAKEISGNEEAQRWATQVRGNLSHLQSFGTDLRTLTLPTFTALISHLAPPISAHERLAIHTAHALARYPSLDPLIYSTFARIMSQVEGGELVVLSRSAEDTGRRNRASSEAAGYRGGGPLRGGGAGAGGGAWTEGPWWRDASARGRSLGSVRGLREGTRLARASAEGYAREFFEARGGVEAAARQASEALEGGDAARGRSSDIFLAVQAVRYTPDADLFAADDAGAQGEGTSAGEEKEGRDDEQVAFAIYLHDPLHSLAFSALSQAFPATWAQWLDADDTDGEEGLPESIRALLATGGVDPREWVAEWMEEVLGTAVGIVAQRYVARRMGVGEAVGGGAGAGELGGVRRRVEEEGVGGEAARAI
ncbi:hypothetical protein LTR53_013202 [Teratosphaeriaceae sp. CCFEE 6253]|nr:hypothetical protein LTR53_013202 [Teratosphaeriaceae sp. CCFEE 6253]